MENDFKKTGIVYLVGAGPGHPDLITRLGYDLLQQCDAVAYDALIPMELIAGLPVRVEKHYVGKRAGKHSLPQSQINELLLNLAQRGLKVVRLKGGDPFIFGRSGEEAEHLAAAGIPVVMVPGVTAASAVAAMSGFSLTNRQAASWIFLATGHGAESASIPVPWDHVAALPGGTFVIYMGLAKLDHLISQLLSSGLAPNTPAIAVQAASTGIQKSVEAPLSELSLQCKCRGLEPPALIVIGEAVRYKTACATESVALAGKRILVTTHSHAASRLCALLRIEGAEPIPYPTVVLEPVCDADEWKDFLETVDHGGLCLFTEGLDVDWFFNALFARGLDARSIHRLKIIAFGSSAESALFQRGIRADQCIDPNDTASLERAIIKIDSVHSLRPILVCGSFGDRQFESRLRRLRSDLLFLRVGTESTARWEAHWGPELIANPPDYIAFTSTAEVDGIFKLIGDSAVRRLTAKARIAVLDGNVAEALQRHSLTAAVQPNNFSLDNLVQSLKQIDD
jgi:uroporphyrinogen III methyltransferase / synthase